MALTRERVLAEAIAMADEAGIRAVSMRKLAQRLGVEAMSLYHHVKNKSQLLDGMVDAIFDEITMTPSDLPWREALTVRCRSVREVSLRHPWAVALLDSRENAGFQTLRQHNAVIGCFREAGFDIAMAAHGFALIDAFVFGFVIQETALPFTNSDELQAVAGPILDEAMVAELPHLVEMVVGHVLKPGYAYAEEFEFGLSLILDGLERRLAGA